VICPQIAVLRRPASPVAAEDLIDAAVPRNIDAVVLRSAVNVNEFIGDTIEVRVTD
jgi:hypothetical protein